MQHFETYELLLRAFLLFIPVLILLHTGTMNCRIVINYCVVYRQDWAVQFYHDLKEEIIRISVVEEQRDRAKQCIEEATVRGELQVPVPDHVFVKPVRHRFRFLANTSNSDSGNSNSSSMDGTFPKPTQPVPLKPGTLVESPENKKLSLLGGTIADKKTGITVAHAFGQNHHVGVSTPDGIRFVGNCRQTFDRVTKNVGGHSFEITADVAVLDLDEACCSVDNTIVWKFSDGSTRELKIKLYKGGELHGDISVVILDKNGTFHQGCICMGEILDKLLETDGLNGVLAITTTEGNGQQHVAISNEGDSGALVMSLPVDGATEVFVYGMVIGVFETVEEEGETKDQDFQKVSMTVANSLWEVIEGMQINGVDPSQIDFAKQ